MRRWKAEKAKRAAFNRLALFRPYAKQLEFIASGKEARSRLLMAGNQLGKTEVGSFETAIHLTGLYPDWWPGHRFDRPIRAWAGGDTSETTRDTVQAKLIGPPEQEEMWGSGMIPKDRILGTARRMGVANALDTVQVRHVSGGTSVIGFKSYDQGRAKWQGTTLDWVWFDEEPDLPIYTEGRTRTNTIPDGRDILTFTPLLGASEVVLSFLEDDEAYQPSYAMAAE